MYSHFREELTHILLLWENAVCSASNKMYIREPWDQSYNYWEANSIIFWSPLIGYDFQIKCVHKPLFAYRYNSYCPGGSEKPKIPKISKRRYTTFLQGQVRGLN